MDRVLVGSLVFVPELPLLAVLKDILRRERLGEDFWLIMPRALALAMAGIYPEVYVLLLQSYADPDAAVDKLTLACAQHDDIVSNATTPQSLATYPEHIPHHKIHHRLNVLCAEVLGLGSEVNKGNVINAAAGILNAYPHHGEMFNKLKPRLDSLKAGMKTDDRGKMTEELCNIIALVFDECIYHAKLPRRYRKIAAEARYMSAQDRRADELVQKFRSRDAS